MNLLREYIRELLKETKSSDLPWAELSSTLRSKFPNIGEEFVSVSGKKSDRFELQQRTVSDRSRQRIASFLVGHGNFAANNPPTKISDSDLNDIIGEIDNWASEFGLHVARDQLAMNGNQAILKIGLMDLETDEVEKPALLYHITDPETADIILSQGLQPQSAKRRGKAGEAGEMIASAGRSYPGRVFMFTQLKSAMNRASKDAKIMHRLSFVRDVLEDKEKYNKDSSQIIGRSSTPVILEIDGNKINNIMADPDFEVGSGAVFTIGTVPASAISKLRTVDRGNYVYDWRENYKVQEMLKDDYDGTMSKIKAWEKSEGL
jgi:RNA:NAD 2'-phosphotransferase (TPT1/KptA family)